MSHKVHPIPGVLFSALGTSRTVSAGIVLLLCYFSTSPVSLLTPQWEVCGKSSRPGHLLTQTSMGTAAQAQNPQPDHSRCSSAHRALWCVSVPEPTSCLGGENTLPGKWLSFSLSLNLSDCLHRLLRKLEEHPEGFVPVTTPDLAIRLSKGKESL